MSKTYYTTIGLEVHAELNTKSKMFCSCKNDPDEMIPNTNICPVCMAHPGTLPVPNNEAIKSVVRVGLSIGGKVAWEFTEFDRKNYFYPDIPKGYQISQYKYPIVSGGELAGVTITRVHLEEDTATSSHQGDKTLIDFNRAGVPLMELVTEPVIHSAKDAGNFGRELQLLLRYLGVSDANMEKGQMRVELNISVSDDPNVFGTKVEVKNLNSFNVVERAAAYEVERMTALLEAGRKDEIIQETRGWDDNKQATFSQRKKENSHDYRYFPDPDIPKYKLRDMFSEDELRNSIPELPAQKRERYAKEFCIKAEDIESYVADISLASWFESVVKKLEKKLELIKIASNYVTSDYLGLKKQDPTVALPHEDSFAELVSMVADGLITSRSAKDMLALLTKETFSPKAYAEANGLIQKNDEEAIIEFAKNVITRHQDVVTEYKNGKESSIQFLVGQVMKESKGTANPQTTLRVLKNLLS